MKLLSLEAFSFGDCQGLVNVVQILQEARPQVKDLGLETL